MCMLNRESMGPSVTNEIYTNYKFRFLLTNNHYKADIRETQFVYSTEYELMIQIVEDVFRK